MFARVLLSFIFIGGINISLIGQELNFSVKINTQKVQKADPVIFETLTQTMLEFLNNQKWTDDVFQLDEKINCNLLLTIQEEVSETGFKAELAIQSSRPVFNSNYETPLLNYIDKEVSFSYQQFQPLQFSRNTFNDNLSAILSFYVYVILGLDYDSYEPRGGENYFQIAQEIVNNIPQGVADANSGWRSLDGDRNRYWMIENILSPRVRIFRESFYNYHRQGLDYMAGDIEKGRGAIKTALEAIVGVTKSYPNSMIIQMFANSKANEIIEIYKVSPQEERSVISQILSGLDPANANRYRVLR
ncbi:MAG: DUF4835 family protein [Saprospiraceae bacterium]|jgi:hypothetical protein